MQAPLFKMRGADGLKLRFEFKGEGSGRAAQPLRRLGRKPPERAFFSTSSAL